MARMRTWVLGIVALASLAAATIAAAYLLSTRAEPAPVCQTQADSTATVILAASEDPVGQRRTIFEDEDYIFAARNYGPKGTQVPGLFVFSKEARRWGEIKKLSTEGAALGRSPTPEEGRCSVGWDYSGLREQRYATMPLMTSGSLNFPDRILYEEESCTYLLQFNSSWDVEAVLTQFVIKKADLHTAFVEIGPGTVSWGQTVGGLRVGLAPAKVTLRAGEMSFKVRIYYENTGKAPIEVPVHKGANAYRVMFGGEEDGKPFYACYPMHAPQRVKVIRPAAMKLQPGKRFSEEFPLDLPSEAAERQPARYLQPQPFGLPALAAGESLSLWAGLLSTCKISSTDGDWKAPSTLKSGAITVAREKTSVGSEKYEKVFRQAHAGIEAWHVIRTAHITAGIDKVAKEAPGIVPYLLKLAQTGRSEQRGWPYWALLCGTLARVGGQEGQKVLRELAADKQAYRHAREWAKRALEGKIVAPDDHASKLREAMQKMKAPRPDLSKVSSPALSEAVKNAESLWKFMTAPDTPYTDRRAAALQGREVFPVEWLPQLMAAIGELRKEAPQHHWGLRPHPHNNIPYPPNWLDAKLKKMSADQRRRLILGHQWKLPQQASDYPLTWEEEAKAPWPWQVQQTLDDLFVFVRPNYRDEAKAKRWLKAAMQMPCTTDDEAKLFVEASRWSTHFKTMDVMARWRQIALCREFPGAAANAGVYVGEAIRLWDDSRSQAVGQVIVVDILKHSPHKEAKHRAAYGLRHFRERWRAGRYAGKVLRMPEPVTAIITASQMALDPKNGDEWTRLYVYAFSVCEALDSPPMKPDRDMDPESEKVGRALTKFASWFKANRRKLERRATRENAALADVRKVFKSFE